jgi:hypothetical protein
MKLVLAVTAIVLLALCSACGKEKCGHECCDCNVDASACDKGLTCEYFFGGSNGLAATKCALPTTKQCQF